MATRSLLCLLLLSPHRTTLEAGADLGERSFFFSLSSSLFSQGGESLLKADLPLSLCPELGHVLSSLEFSLAVNTGKILNEA